MVKQLSLVWKRLAPTLLCGLVMGMLAFCTQQIVALWIGHAPARLDNIVSPERYWKTLITVVIWAPLFEEWISRKLIIDFALKKSVPVPYALSASAFFFSVFHFSRLSSADVILRTTVLADTFLNGLVLAMIYLRTRRLIYPVIAHAVINAVLSAPMTALEANVNSQNSVFDYIPFVATAIVLLASLIAFAWALLVAPAKPLNPA